jgi:hypothetical protein
MWLELGTISILKQDLPVPGTSSYPVEIPTKLLKIRALWPKWEIGDLRDRWSHHSYDD